MKKRVIKLPTQDLKFVEVAIEELSEDMVFRMIKNGQIRQCDFLYWLSHRKVG